MILGSKFNIEFRSYPHQSKSGRGGGGGYRGRGGFMASSGRDGGSEDPALRWGFKLIIRPIFADPQLSVKHTPTFTKELQAEVMKKLGSELSVSIITILNYLIFVTSNLACSITEADLPQTDKSSLTAKTHGLFKDPKVDIDQQLQRYLSWHLFKGGVKTSFIDQLHSSRALEAAFKDAYSHEIAQRDKTLDSLVAFVEKKAKEISLRKTKTIIKEAEKIDTSVLEFKPDESLWSHEVREIVHELIESKEQLPFLQNLLQIIRKLVPYKMTYTNEKMRPKFKKEYQADWTMVEQLLILVILYHSNSISEVKSALQSTHSQEISTKERVDDKLKLIGQQLNDVLSWMQSRLSGEMEFQFMITDIIDQSQSYIDKVVEKKRAEEEEREKKRVEAEEIARKKSEERRVAAEAEEAKRVQAEQEEAKKAAAEKEKKAPVVSKDKVVNKGKRKNIVKKSAPIKEADLLKMKKEAMKKKEQQKEQKQSKASENTKIEEEKKEDSIDDVIKNATSMEEKKDSEFDKVLNVTPAEEKDIKQKIYMKIYEDFLQLYQGSQDRVKPLCTLLNISFNSEDPNESLKAIFKRVKAKLKPLIDFDGDLPIKEKLDVSILKLESPYKEISKEVKARLFFLLEIIPSADYHSKVIQVDFKKIQKRAQMYAISSQASQDGGDKDSQANYTESSIQGDNDSEILEPLEVARSQSVQVSLKPSLNGIQGVSQAVIAEQSKMNEDDIANWVDNYRKWRQWNRQHRIVNKGQQFGTFEFIEDDLTSPYCSPLFSVVAFAKASKILNPEKMRETMINQQLKAGFRSLGLKYHDQLFNLIQATPYFRFIQSNLSFALQESTFNKIETCGVSLVQSINENSRQIAFSLMNKVITLRAQIKELVDKRLAQYHKDKQAQSSSNLNQSGVKDQASQQPPLTQAQIVALQAQQQKAASQQKQNQMREELNDNLFLKNLLQQLNDVRVILNDFYTREYLLEQLRQQGKQLLKNSKLGGKEPAFSFELIKNFLTAIVELMLQFNSGSSQLILKSSNFPTTKLQFAISNCCKLIMNQFMTDKSMMRSSETHRFLQESLLDIVVRRLEILCGLHKIKSTSNSEEIVDGQGNEERKSQPRKSRPPGYKLNHQSYQDEIVQLMKLLSEVIRISNDHQQHLQTIKKIKAQVESETADQKIQSYFLREGSEQVMKCGSILTFIMHNVEVPVVMRQTIKCAKLFFKLVDFNQLKLHTIKALPDEEAQGNQFLSETLKQIGAKITNTNNDLKKVESTKDEEKLYVVYANINSSDEDFSFLITALYNWETMYPSFSKYFPTDPKDIVVKSSPAKKEEGKLEEKKSEEKKDEEVEQPAHIDDLVSAQFAKLAQLQESEANVDMEELQYMQRQQNSMRGGYRGGRGGYGSQNDRQSMLQSQMENKMRHQMVQGAYIGSNISAKSSAPGGYVRLESNIYPQQPQISISSHAANSIGIIKLDAMIDELIKSTWQDALDTDTEEEKMRKLNERNANWRMQTHLKDAISLAVGLYTRYSAPIMKPMPLKMALEFSNILQKAYQGQLSPIPLNPFLKEESKEKKMSNQKTVTQHFPLLMKTIDNNKKKEIPPGHCPPITIAPKKLVVSLAESSLSGKYETLVETKNSSLKAIEKQPLEGFKCGVIPHSIRRQGASISVIIQEFISLLRSLINPPLPPQSSTRLIPALSIESDLSFNKKRSIQIMQQQHQHFLQEMVGLTNGVISAIGEKNWDTFSQDEKLKTYGVLAVIGGWTPPLKTGQPVQVEINNQWVGATIVDDGLGKKKMTVILDDDDTLALQKVPVNKVRSSYTNDWLYDGLLSQLIKQEALCTAVIKVYSQIHSTEGQKLNESKSTQSSILSLPYLLLMLLKVTAQIRWNFLDKSNEIFTKFISIVSAITKEELYNQSEEDKARGYWEKSLIESWERLIDRDEQKNYDFFVVKENMLKEIAQITKELQDKVAAAIEQEKKEESKAESQAPSMKKELQQNYQDIEFVQPLSSYLKGLPEPIPKKNSSIAALKLLAYWEKNIIPKIIEFVKTTYKAWEMEMYFEQLRHHLRVGDSLRALDDAMTMWERKVPQGTTIPEENHDWTCKMIDECIVDSWALAKFKPPRSRDQNSQQQQMASQSGQQGETSFPLLNKLINLGIEEIVVLIKAVDMRANVVLVEYQDPDTMQVHSIWIPVSHLSDLHNPLPPRAIGFTQKTLIGQFENGVQKIESIYARQTLIQFFLAFQELAVDKDRIFQLPPNDFQLQEIISWSVWEEFSSDPVSGWMKELNSAIPLTNSTKSQLAQSDSNNDVSSLIQAKNTLGATISESSKALYQIVQDTSDKISIERLQSSGKMLSGTNRGGNSLQTLNIVRVLFEQVIHGINESEPKTLETDDTKLVNQIVDWCIMNWYNISERIRTDRAVFDLCSACDQYANQLSSDKNDDLLQAEANLLPLHSLIEKEAASSGGSIGTLIMFKKNGVHLTPTSKISFYSDKNKVNLIAEINAGTEGRKDLPPLLLNHGKVWVQYDSGTSALLPRHQQNDMKSSLPCAIVQIPKTWTVCCWLTEMLSSSLLLNVEKSFKYTIDIYEKLIGALTTFYEEAKAPSMLKSFIFNLLSRLIIKLRYVYSRQPTSIESNSDKLKQHFSRIFIKKEFMETLFSELLVHKEQEEHANQFQLTKQSILYTAFVQDCVELILIMMMPTVKGASLESFKDLLYGIGIEIPEWLHPLIKTLYFMQYFSGEMALSRDVQREIYNETKFNFNQLDQILVLQGIPCDQKNEEGARLYSNDFIKGEVIKIITKHGGRIIDPSTDMVFSDHSDTLVVLLDGIDHMKLVADSSADKEAEVIPNEDESDLSSEENEVKKEVKKPVKKEEEEMPVIFSCPICTFENPLSSPQCEMCGTERPPMEQIIAEFRQANLPPPEVKPETKEGQDAPAKTPVQLILEDLAKDCKRIFSRLERKAYKEKLVQIEKDKQKALEEAKALALEESQKKEAPPPKRPEEDKKKEKKSIFPPERFERIVSRSGTRSRHSEDSAALEEHVFEGEDQEEMWESMEERRPPARRDGRGDRRGGRGGPGDAQRQKLIDMGYDPDELEQDPGLMQAVLESLRQEEEKEQEAKMQKEKEEEEKARKLKEEEEKKRLKELEASGQAPVKPKWTKLTALIGESQVFENMEASRIVFQVLSQRLSDTANLEEGLNFNAKVIAALKDIHESYQQLKDFQDTAPLPHSALLEEVGITSDTIKSDSFEQFVANCLELAMLDVKELIRFMQSQGIDLWMHRAFFLSSEIPAAANTKVTIHALEKLKAFIEVELCKESKGIVALHPSMLRLVSKVGVEFESAKEKPVNQYNDTLFGANYPEIQDPSVTQADLRYQWALLRVFNKYLAPTVPFINTSQSVSDLVPQCSIPMKLAAYMSSTRNLCLLNVKFDLRHLILEKTSVQVEHPHKLYFERLKLAHRNRDIGQESVSMANNDNDDGGNAEREKQASQKDKKQEFMFVQAYEQIKDIVDLAQFRPKKPQGAEPHLSFHIVFRGEHVVGEGGPYRQFFADISQELQPSVVQGGNGSAQASQRLLGLLCPSPNNRSGSNIGKGKFILSPSRTSSQDLSLFEFLGVLMGVCIRTGAHMNIDLPQFVWKQLAGQRVAHEDLIEIDIGYWKLLNFMLNASRKAFDETSFETWSVLLSDQETLVELREGGKEQRVTYEERVEFIEQALYTRLKECQLHCQAIKRGISQVIPEALLNMVTYSELETWVCGKSIVDIDLLKRHTKYGGDKKTTLLSEDSRRIKWLWEVLRAFSEEDKQKLIKFCWGQHRLPANDEEFERRQTRFMIKPAMNTKHGDQALPKADTCFFNLELPDYSSMEIMRERILLAIHTDCDSINADDRPEQENHGGGGRRDRQDSYDDEY